MGKIRVSDLARKMNIPTQDLIFKLKSIGVRIDEEDPQIDTDTFQAILQGKKLPQPREVILRDDETPPAPARVQRRPGGAGVARRLGPGPLRPTRRRTIIQKVEPRIRTIPTSDRPSPAAERPRPAAGPATPAAGPATPPAAATPAAREAIRPAPGREAPKRPLEVVDPTVRPETSGVDAKKPKRGKKAPAAAEPDQDLRAYRGSVREIEEAEEAMEADRAPAATPSGRRRRRERRREEAEQGGRLLQFKEAPPSGPITVAEGMTLRLFAEKLGVKAKDLIKVLFDSGIVANINYVLDPELAAKIAKDLGVEAMTVSFEEEVQLQQENVERGEAGVGTVSRAPVVTIMGHVDHGKTTLLDSIRKSKVTESEFGGITQHIGAYQVEKNGHRIVFVDTPGHEAFTMMRARGAKVTDIVVLVVAADDGVMPQTREAVDHARAAGVPILVAINKIDKPNANLERVKKDLSDLGLTVEDWGGQTVAVPISALKGQGINELLEMILLSADLLELKASPGRPAQGVVLEARKEAGRGVVATVLVQDGTLRVSDVFVAGATWGRVRTMTDDRGHKMTSADPATPVEISGFDSMPVAGESFQVVEEEAKARSIVEFRRQEQRHRDLVPGSGRVSLDQLFSAIQQGVVKELKVVLKADVQGSAEVLTDTLPKLSTDRVKVQIIHSGVGAITTNDVLLASASEAVVIGFNVRPERAAAELADKEQVEVRLHTVIYELADELRKAMTGLLEPVYEEVDLGRAEVREIFKVPKVGMVAGCHVLDGVIRRNASARLLRDNRVVYEGRIGSLRRFKEDAAEVRSGFDCGIRLEGFQDVKPGDAIEAYGRREIAPSL